MNLKLELPAECSSLSGGQGPGCGYVLVPSDHSISAPNYCTHESLPIRKHRRPNGVPRLCLLKISILGEGIYRSRWAVAYTEISNLTDNCTGLADFPSINWSKLGTVDWCTINAAHLTYAVVQNHASVPVMIVISNYAERSPTRPHESLDSRGPWVQVHQ